MADKYIKVSDIEEYCTTNSAYLQGKGQSVAQAALRRVKEFAIENAVDVQPADRWISVDEALPKIDKPVLVYYQCYWGKGDIAKECGISKYYIYCGKWSTLHIPIDSEVLYWQPLPEPPVKQI